MSRFWWMAITGLILAVALSPTELRADWAKNVIGTLEAAWSISVGDLDGDGDIDVAGTDWEPPGEVAWFRRDGPRSFTKQTIDPSSPRPRAIFVGDIDGDQDRDLLTVTDESEDLVLWYENNGAGSFTEHSVGSLNDGEDVFAVDLDQDQDADVVAAGLWGNEVAWYENNGAQAFTKHTIEATTAPAYAVWPVDLDRDGDLDIVSGIGLNGAGLWWYENDGNENFTKRVIDANYQLNDVWVGDIDGDSDLDLFTASIYGHEFTWFENSGAQSFTKHTIRSNGDSYAISIYGADLDNDGDIDAVGADLARNEIIIFENDGSENFAATVIDNFADGAAEVYVADMDGDADPDVAAALSLAGQLIWYENLMPAGQTEPRNDNRPVGPEPISVPAFFRKEIPVRFAAPAAGPLLIRLCDVTGREIYSAARPSTPRALSLGGARIGELRSGIYLLTASADGGRYRVMAKLIKL